MKVQIRQKQKTKNKTNKQKKAHCPENGLSEVHFSTKPQKFKSALPRAYYKNTDTARSPERGLPNSNKSEKCDSLNTSLGNLKDCLEHS